MNRKAIQLLDECEQGLRGLVAEAAGLGDYGSVQRIADIAKAVSALAAEGRGEQSSSAPVPQVPSASPRHTGPGSAERRRTPPADYPRFFRRGDELVKVGWSKKDRREYNHRAPRAAVDAVAASVRHVGAKGKVFNGDALLPLKDLIDGTAIPDYQAYVALAWLKHLGVVTQEGKRSGYTLTPDKSVDSTITAAWPELAEWRR
jgi:hypothetical protein